MVTVVVGVMGAVISGAAVAVMAVVRRCVRVVRRVAHSVQSRARVLVMIRMRVMQALVRPAGSGAAVRRKGVGPRPYG